MAGRPRSRPRIAIHCFDSTDRHKALCCNRLRCGPGDWDKSDRSRNGGETEEVAARQYGQVEFLSFLDNLNRFVVHSDSATIPMVRQGVASWLDGVLVEHPGASLSLDRRGGDIVCVERIVEIRPEEADAQRRLLDRAGTLVNKHAKMIAARRKAF